MFWDELNKLLVAFLATQYSQWSYKSGRGNVLDLESGIEKIESLLAGELSQLTPGTLAKLNSLLGKSLAVMVMDGGSPQYLEKALSLQQQALKIFGNLEDRAAISDCLADMALTKCMSFEFLGDVTSLDEAVAFARSAIQIDEHTSQRHLKQNVLGIALLRRGKHKSNITDLDDAIESFGEATTTIDRLVSSNDWAMINHNRGAALIECGRMTANPDLFKQAAELFEDARVTWEQAGNGPSAALASLNQGVAYSEYSARHFVEEFSSDAIYFCENATRFWSEDVYPLRLGRAYHCMSLAHFQLAKHQREKASYFKALTLAVDAARLFHANNDLPSWSDATCNAIKLRISLSTLSQSHDEHASYLRDGATLCKEALLELDSNQYPRSYAHIELVLGLVQAAQAGAQSDDKALFERAAGHLHAAEGILTIDTDPLTWASIQMNLSWCLTRLGIKTISPSTIASGEARLTELLREIDDRHFSWIDRSEVEDRLREARLLRSTLFWIS